MKLLKLISISNLMQNNSEYTRAYKAFKNGSIKKKVWEAVCLNALSEILDETNQVFKRLKNRK